VTKVEAGVGNTGLGVNVDVPAAGTQVGVGVGGGGADVGVDVGTPPAVDPILPGGSNGDTGSGSGGGSNSGDTPTVRRPPGESAGSSPSGNTATTRPDSRDSAGKKPGAKSGGGDEQPRTSISSDGDVLTALAGTGADAGGARGGSNGVNESRFIITRIVADMPGWMKLLVGAFGLAALAFAGFWLRERRNRRIAERAAMVDALTGVANRKAFDARLAEEWERSKRHGNALGVMLVDLDGFKEVNDTRGHTVGDAVLREVAERLTARVRSTDIVARIGGDEFAVICPETELSGLVDLRKGLESYVTFSDAAPVGLSIGVAEIEPRDGEHQDLLDRADRSMYRRKRLHRAASEGELVDDTIPISVS
jgi:diguanylate cyclase (GGDEF)-like protein